LLSPLLIGPVKAVCVENRRGRLSENLVAALAKARLQSLSPDFLHARRDTLLRTLGRLNLSSFCMRQKHVDIGVGAMAAGEILGARRGARLASRKTRHKPGDSGGKCLA
jgi:hypothetical protein